MGEIERNADALSDPRLNRDFAEKLRGIAVRSADILRSAYDFKTRREQRSVPDSEPLPFICVGEPTRKQTHLLHHYVPNMPNAQYHYSVLFFLNPMKYIDGKRECMNRGYRLSRLDIELLHVHLQKDLAKLPFYEIVRGKEIWDETVSEVYLATLSPDGVTKRVANKEELGIVMCRGVNYEVGY